MEFLEEEKDKLLKEIKERARAEGAYTHDAWRTIVDDVLGAHEEFGEIEEEHEQNLREEFYAMFEAFKGDIPSS